MKTASTALMLLLAAPLATPDARAARDLARALTVRGSQLQIATPWFVPTREARTPEGLLPPDGALAGLVAATVLARGAARTAAGRAPLGVLAVAPTLPDGALRTAELHPDDDGALLHRFAVFGPTADGVRLLSDRSASRVDGWRHAGVVRLLGQLLRTARQVGETLVFEPSGEALWSRVRGRFEDLLTRYWEAGALRGATPRLSGASVDPELFQRHAGALRSGHRRLRHLDAADRGHRHRDALRSRRRPAHRHGVGVRHAVRLAHPFHAGR